jgi:O-antigen/teichoic acid export membrane protein
MSERKQLIPLLSGKIIALLLTIVSPMVLTRFLTQHDFGIYSQFYVILGVLLGIVPMSIQNSIYYFYPILDSQRQKLLVVQTFFILSIFALITILTLNIPLVGITIFKQNGLGLYLDYFFVVFFGSMITLFIHPLYVIKKDKLTSLIFPIFEIFFKVLLIVLFIIIFKNNLTSVFHALVLLSFLTGLFTIIYVVKEIKGLNFAFNRTLLYDQLRYSMPFGLAMFVKTIASNFDKIVCIFYILPDRYALYSIAFYGVPGINMVYSSFVEVNLVPLTQNFNNGNIEGFLILYKKIIVKTFSFTFPLIIIVGLFSDQLILFLFSEKYISAAPFFRTFLLTFILLPVGAGLILRCTGNTRKTLKAYVYSGIVSIPTTIILIKQFELNGAIVSSVFSSILPVIFLIREEVKLLKMPFVKILPIQPMIKIIIISFLSLIPFLVFKLIFHLGILSAIFNSVFYLIIVAFFLINADVFVIDKVEVQKKLKLLRN